MRDRKMIRLDESSIQDATCSDEGQHDRCPLGESLHPTVGRPFQGSSNQSNQGVNVNSSDEYQENRDTDDFNR